MGERVSQIPIEIIVSPDTGKERVSQLPIEVVVSPTTSTIRVSQFVVEVIIPNTSIPPMSFGGAYWQWIIT